MEERGGYGQFCPVAMASEILCSRWTILIVRELLAGTTRFNELRRGVPRMSPALLSKRLKELERAGGVVTVPKAHGTVEYRLSKIRQEVEAGNVDLGGDPAIVSAMHQWLGLSPFATEARRMG